ncbi:hypothetical protein D9619_008491 [Psilocybe cf. subviscida]|uniref:Uncharacterized protein n=1 Tax=Psilocybe cf. subviscida TaxID=2480587 RepID=A0A8H5BAK6_9AGAR|nr:hypothetical protein D9619_008491 [Psilocybe cf. subviscida]
MSSVSSSSTPFRVEDSARTTPEAGPSTAASSPPNHEASEYSCAASEVGVDEEEEVKATKALSRDEKDTEKRMARLQFVLQRSAVFSGILKTRMDEEKERQVKLQAEKRKQQAGTKRTRGARGSPKGKKRKGTDGKAQIVHEEPEEDEDTIFQQPALITGAKLKPYQLEGLQWMVSLDQNGISGILADEMGLGKTLQTIAFSAYLREHGNFKPFLVVCPLSVMHNWHDEYKKFAPDIPVVMYHGLPQERAEMRATVMAPPGRGRKAKPGQKSKPKPKAPVPRGRGRPRKSTVVLESDEEEEVEEHGYTVKFPIVLTTYEMIIRDRTHLAHYEWGYIVVDEGHRLKNLDCKLMQEIKKYSSAGRMILTGTPLHNNLAELWSLLNFILPDIFDDVQTFQDWFNLPELQSSLPTSQSQQIISSLHAILKPFLLRRMKIDVETNLPPKKEYVLYAPLSVRQRDAYDHVLNGGVRQWLIQGGAGNAEAIVTKVEANNEEDPIVIEDSDEDEEEDVPLAKAQTDKREKEKEAKKPRTSDRRVKGGRKSYAVDVDDDEYFEMVERGEFDERGLLKTVLSQEEQAVEDARVGQEYQKRMKVRQVNNMRLQNTVMQLRKVCSHPFLFEWPTDPKTCDLVIGEELVYASGKMMVLDRLLKELFKRKHKVLLFSQFTTMLDIIEEWAVNFMGWPICRIDGSTKPLERRSEMERFQTGGDAPDAPCLFLLSTRAGGLGINLVAADTVIFYDQDWNPQMDAQAQDRAHRIGQKKPVLIYRLVSAHTVETKIMQRAGEKRKLEALVIAKGKFKKPAAAAATNKRETMAEMASSLLRLEGEKIEVVPNTKEGKLAVLSDEDLDALLDRSPEVFAERGVGWTSAEAAGPAAVTAAEANVGKKAAFAVYEAPPEEGNDALAKIMGEDEDAE